MKGEAYRQRVEGGGVNLILSRGHDTHQPHVRDAVDFKDRVYGHQRAAIRCEATQQRQVPPARAPLWVKGPETYSESGSRGGGPGAQWEHVAGGVYMSPP